MKLAFRLIALALIGVGIWWTVKLVQAMMRPDWALAWIIFTFVVGCFWVAVILVRGSGRPLK